MREELAFKIMQNPWRWATTATVCLFFMLILTTAGHYGESWDEDIRYQAGEKKLEYYSSLFTGDLEKAKSIGASKDKYPGFHDLNLAIIRRISPLSDRINGNIFSAVLGALTVIGTIQFTRRIFSERAGFLAAVLLITLPAFYGHSFINPKDIPFACGYIWSLNFISYWLKGSGLPSGKVTLLTGLAIGIATATRIGGLVLFCYLGLFVILYQSYQAIIRKQSSTNQVYGQFIRIGIAGLITLIVLLAYWPYGQLAPFTRAAATLEAISSFSWDMPVVFEGKFYNVLDLPFYYILKMLLIKVPVLTLAAFWGGMGTILFRVLRKSSQITDFQFAEVLLVFSVVFPLGYVIARDSTLYNGIRHVLFILPPVCIISASAIDALLNYLKTNKNNLMLPVGIGVSASIMLTIVNMIRLHPYQYIYYNELVGGTTNASHYYETDYWCTVYKELGEEFHTYLKTQKPSFTRPEVIVNMEHVTWLLTPFIPKNTSLPIRILRSSPQIDDYYISSTAWMADQFYYGNTVILVERNGVILGQIKDRRHLTADERKLGYPN